jgi:hypothetical protein
MFGHDVLGFQRTHILIRKSFGGTGFQPVQSQAKVCGYILSTYPLNIKCKIPAGHYWGHGEHSSGAVIVETHVDGKSSQPQAH